MVETTSQTVVWVRDLAEARRFYGDELGSTEGKKSENSLEFKLGSAHIECRLSLLLGKAGRAALRYQLGSSRCELIPHHTVLFEPPQWREFLSRLRRRRLECVVESSLRTRPVRHSQATVVLLDPSGNVTEFKPTVEVPRPWHRISTIVTWASAVIAIAVMALVIYRNDNVPPRVDAEQNSPNLSHGCGGGWLCLR
jgi:uncharacterized protein